MHRNAIDVRRIVRPILEGSMHRNAIVLFLLLLASAAPATETNLFPLPPELEPNVRFWTRIYTDVPTTAGLLHDSVELDVVYETLHFPEGLSRRSRDRKVQRTKKKTRAILRQLAKGKRTGLSADEARVLGRWPAGVTNKTLARAARRVRFQSGLSDRFYEGLVRSGQWSAKIERVLKEHGVPRELVALPHVESSFNPRAYSRIGAAGIWQFTRSTGRLYMRVDHVVDERMNPERATVGAARLLRDNHARVQSWPLAITGYNHGISGMERAARKLRTRDMGVISRKYEGRTFGFASRNFYAEFLAASAVHENPEPYFGRVNYKAPLVYDRLVTDAYYSTGTLQHALGVDRVTLREHNLALRPSVWNGAKLVPKGYEVRVPRHALEQPVESVLAQIPDRERVSRQKRDRFHKVRRGESLSVIARRYETSQRELVHLNNLRSRHRIRAGQILRLPTDGSAPIEVARAEPPANGIYRVRRGDNLTIIAARFGVDADAVARWNGLRNRNRLAIGQRLRVTQAGTVVASAPEATNSDAVVVTRTAPPPASTPPVSERRTPERKPQSSFAAPEPAAPELPANVTVVAVAPRPAEAVPDPSNYAVSAGGRVTVQAEETLGHYAEWLEVSASRLRQLNAMRYRAPLVIGRTKRLDFSRVTPEVFEQRRLEYHRDLQEEFFDAWSVAGTTKHVIRRGDSLWYLANKKFEVPIWLLRQYNPDLDFGALPAGAQLVVPLLDPQETVGRVTQSG